MSRPFAVIFLGLVAIGIYILNMHTVHVSSYGGSRSITGWEKHFFALVFVNLGFCFFTASVRPFRDWLRELLPVLFFLLAIASLSKSMIIGWTNKHT